MAKLTQSLNLSQTLRMTPQLQQAIKMLQLSRMEMETSIRAELEENPILEEVQELKEEDLKRTKEVEQELTASSDAQDATKQDDFEWESYLDQKTKSTAQSYSGNEEIMNYENMITTHESLHDYLSWQARMFGFNSDELRVAETLIDYIDDDGYVLTPLEEIAASESIEVGELEDVLKFIQEFDPPGVGARNLKECLLIQAKVLEEDTTDLVNIINNHLKDLEKRNFDHIAKSMGRDVLEIVDMCNIVYGMEPKPGRAYSPPDAQYVTPDVFVYKVGEDYLISLNEDGLPRLKISNFYRNFLKNPDKLSPKPQAGTAEAKGPAELSNGPSQSASTQDYIQEKLRSALWLIKSIHQRQRTIYKVAESIVKQQKDFFEKGPGFIKPMVLRDVANDIGMHESTVSRVTTAKYMHTPQGIFELKYFFNSGIATSDGESLASESVKLKIKSLVNKEDPKSPLSDQDIVNLLKKDDGIHIARRTVAKYRDVLKILPSSRRKKIY
jgi:RNA polymerase sigma-54 factor